MTYNIIATGSNGNATVINDTILIDCGVSMKALRPYADKLKLVLLTHTHGDHFRKRTVAQLARLRPALRWACRDWMVGPLEEAGVGVRCIDVFQDGETMTYDGIATVRPERIPHDVPNCCWRVLDDEGSLFYATDAGSLDGIVAKNFGIYLVEANHLRVDIEARAAEKEAAGLYAYEKRAAENHLSYEQAVDWLTANMGANSIWVPMHQHEPKNGGL